MKKKNAKILFYLFKYNVIILFLLLLISIILENYYPIISKYIVIIAVILEVILFFFECRCEKETDYTSIIKKMNLKYFEVPYVVATVIMYVTGLLLLLFIIFGFLVLLGNHQFDKLYSIFTNSFIIGSFVSVALLSIASDTKQCKKKKVLLNIYELKNKKINIIELIENKITKSDFKIIKKLDDYYFIKLFINENLKTKTIVVDYYMDKYSEKTMASINNVVNQWEHEYYQRKKMIDKKINIINICYVNELNNYALASVKSPVGITSNNYIYILVELRSSSIYISNNNEKRYLYNYIKKQLDNSDMFLKKQKKI